MPEYVSNRGDELECTGLCYEPRVRRFHMTLDKSQLLGISHYDSFRGHRVSWVTHSTSHTCYMLIDCII